MRLFEATFTSNTHACISSCLFQNHCSEEDQIENGLPSSVSIFFRSPLVDADDGGNNDRGSEGMLTCACRADKMSAETHVTISCGHVIRWGVSIGAVRLAVLKIGGLCTSFEFSSTLAILSLCCIVSAEFLLRD